MGYVSSLEIDLRVRECERERRLAQCGGQGTFLDEVERKPWLRYDDERSYQTAVTLDHFVPDEPVLTTDGCGAVLLIIALAVMGVVLAFFLGVFDVDASEYTSPGEQYAYSDEWDVEDVLPESYIVEKYGDGYIVHDIDVDCDYDPELGYGNYEFWDEIVDDDWDTVKKEDEFPETRRYTGNFIKRLQNELARLGFWIDSDEITEKWFGPTTALAVRKFQIRNNLTPNGVCDKTVAEALGFSAASRENIPKEGIHYEANLMEAFGSAARSKSNYAVLVSTNPRKLSGPVVSVFCREWDVRSGSWYWRLHTQEPCAIGACKTGADVTPPGVHDVSYFADVPDEPVGNLWYFYQVGFYDRDFAILAVGYDLNTETFEDWVVDTENQVYRDRQGRLTGGSVRVPYEFAKWLYDNLDYDTVIVIDDRNYG